MIKSRIAYLAYKSTSSFLQLTCRNSSPSKDKCQKCDKSAHYWGDPINSSCFYDLAIDYQFTFNLSKPDDRHLTGINFKNKPEKVEVDVDFSITCSVNSKVRASNILTKEQHPQESFTQAFIYEKEKRNKSVFSIGRAVLARQNRFV